MLKQEVRIKLDEHIFFKKKKNRVLSLKVLEAGKSKIERPAGLGVW